MKTIGILETGIPPEALRAEWSSYGAMFERLIGPDYAYRTYPVLEGALPDRPEACDAYLITGSPAGVYDDLPWIAPLKDFLQRAKGRAAIVGICFGHQMMAEAFGGKVEKSDRGWGVGLHTYGIEAVAPWMDSAAPISIPAVHQDQVVVQPPNTRVLAASGFTPFAALAYEDQPAFSIQPHPEFSAAFAIALMENEWQEYLDAATAEAAIQSLKAPNDNARIGGWIRRFLDSSPLS